MRFEPVTGAASEWRRNWPVVLAASAGVAISTINTYSTGLFIPSLEHDFGWSRTQITSGAAIAAVTTVILAPFMGAAVDRFGPRRIGIVGIVSLCCLTALLGASGSSIWSWRFFWCLLALINVFIVPTVWTAAVSGLFSAGRGLALAATLCGSGIGSLMTPVLTYRLIERLGWRLAFVGLATIWGVIVIPTVLIFFTSVQDRRRSQRRPAAAAEAAAGTAGRRDLASRRFLQLAMAGFLIATVVVSFAVSVVPILSSRGLDRSEAAGLASILGFASITGRLTIGFLLDRIEGRFLAGASVLLPIGSSLLLILMPGSAGAAGLAVLIVGLALGAELDLVAYLTSRYFGLENFGMLFGTIGGLVTLAGGCGPMAISFIYDTSHSYLLALWASIPICLLSSMLFLLLGPYPTLDKTSFPRMKP
jgi:MFS family permease